MPNWTVSGGTVERTGGLEENVKSGKLWLEKRRHERR